MLNLCQMCSSLKIKVSLKSTIYANYISAYFFSSWEILDFSHVLVLHFELGVSGRYQDRFSSPGNRKITKTDEGFIARFGITKGATLTEAAWQVLSLYGAS
jgi:hypothetical protein